MSLIHTSLKMSRMNTTPRCQIHTDLKIPKSLKTLETQMTICTHILCATPLESNLQIAASFQMLLVAAALIPFQLSRFGPTRYCMTQYPSSPYGLISYRALEDQYQGCLDNVLLYDTEKKTLQTQEVVRDGQLVARGGFINVLDSNFLQLTNVSNPAIEFDIVPAKYPDLGRLSATIQGKQFVLDSYAGEARFFEEPYNQSYAGVFLVPQPTDPIAFNIAIDLGNGTMRCPRLTARKALDFAALYRDQEPENCKNNTLYYDPSGYVYIKSQGTISLLVPNSFNTITTDSVFTGQFIYAPPQFSEQGNITYQSNGQVFKWITFRGFVEGTQDILTTTDYQVIPAIN
ncbi:hypothetical protein EDD86DRAFT_212354 [Gorgonomyces haynaldii]|nr:hypothetical protein EDD86DRAFT_212354 [Gorgonomyces haynaldii]